ncbi:ABC transporter permease [Hydrogenophaga sp.]|uniref:ABC transporter permease n=1 Tax=Hydrogenophaga sp. TaxID=1904254 RepID=UPI00356400DE
MKFLNNKLFMWFASLGVLAGLVGLWQVAAQMQLISPVFFPAPTRSFESLWDQMGSADFWIAFRATLTRMALGFVVASLAGVALGAAIGLSPRLRAYIEPSLELIRPLPASAMVPVFVLLVGLNDRMIVTAIAFSSLWPVLLNTVHGFKTIEPRLVEVARILHLSRLELIWKIALPNAMPDIFAGLRLALTVSLILAVVAEMLAGTVGLGQNITLAARSFRSADLYAGIIVLGAVGYLSNVLMERAERHLLRWRTA